MKRKPLFDEDGIPSGNADGGQQLTPGGYHANEVSSALYHAEPFPDSMRAGFVELRAPVQSIFLKSSADGFL